MNTLDLIRKNKEKLAIKTAKYLKAQIEPKPKERIGFYQGFNNNKHLVKLRDGSTIQGDLISNGAINIGARVIVSVPDNGTPLIKSVSG